MQLLAENQDKISWYWLSINPSKGAMQLLAENQDKISWYWLSRNPSSHAMQLLAENQDKIIWENLFFNPSIIVYDYETMQKNCLLFKEELMKDRFHPRNLAKFSDWGIDGFDSDSEPDADGNK